MIRTIAAAVHVTAVASLLLLLGSAMSDPSPPVLGFTALALCVVAADQLITWPLWLATGKGADWHPVRGWWT